VSFLPCFSFFGAIVPLDMIACVCSLLSPEELNVQLVRMNQGLESTSVTAAQFLQEPNRA
jgi:hypothetical protein